MSEADTQAQAREPSIREARALAQQLAFGPLTFQAVAALDEMGALQLLWEERNSGLTITETAARLQLSDYAVTVLFQAAASAKVLLHSDDHHRQRRFRLSNVGYCLLHDEMTRRNFAFVRDVCYQPAAALTGSLREGVPLGLQMLGGRALQRPTTPQQTNPQQTNPQHDTTPDTPKTLYAVLREQNEQFLHSWHAFDHFYSDAAFEQALEVVLRHEPQRLLDIGANTGRFCTLALNKAPRLHATLVDHPAQLDVAREQLLSAGLEGRFDLAPMDLTADRFELPSADAIWLSQLLDCLSPPRVVRLLRSASRALSSGGTLYVLEPCVDRQRDPVAELCLTHTSLYFSCLANGNSRMYESTLLEQLVREAGMQVTQRIDDLGYGHSLFCCHRAPSANREDAGPTSDPGPVSP